MEEEMATINIKDNKKNRLGLDRYGRKGISKEFSIIFVHLLLLLLLSGRPGWVNAWIYAGLFLVLKIISMTVLIGKDPDLINERGLFIKKDTKPFDKLFFCLWIPLNFAMIVLAGLDAGRFGWTKMPVEANVIGAVIISGAFLIGLWAMVLNTHFEATVRIQADRDHQVCNAGPYRIIRHPGYACAIISTICVPLLLGSVWGLIPAGLVSLLFIVRTILEDRTLRAELPGYTEYARSTRYRLMPFVW